MEMGMWGGLGPSKGDQSEARDGTQRQGDDLADFPGSVVLTWGVAATPS